MTLVGF